MGEMNGGKSRPLICGFMKVRNEIVRNGNLYHALANLERFCDVFVLCDDASTDGTGEFLRAWLIMRAGGAIQGEANDLLHTARGDWLYTVRPQEQNFENELAVKERMLGLVHQIEPQFIWWHDGDEILEEEGVQNLGEFCQKLLTLNDPRAAWAFHYTQFWRNTSWARLDADFDTGWFVKLWKYTPELSFVTQYGTHHQQFPQQIQDAWRMDQDVVGRADVDVLHYGNFGVNLRWKCIQYSGGLGGVPRHMNFEEGQYRAVEHNRIPREAIKRSGPTPRPFTPEEKAIILEMKNLKRLDGWFTVVVPTYNRQYDLIRALGSLLAQTYQKWVALVLDDGSTDNTPLVMADWQERDPRIFYCRYPTNRGGVAMNEIGMRMACEWTEYWTRLGSDDAFAPRKLELDVEAFRGGTTLTMLNHAVFGPYRVIRAEEGPGEMSNPPQTPEAIAASLRAGDFRVSWANCAVRTSVLAAIHKRYGNFCDPSLRNMEDFLVNSRIARVVDWIWRGEVKGEIIVNPSPAMAMAMQRSEDGNGTVPDAFWTDATTQPSGPENPSASANAEQSTKDLHRTLALIADENEREMAHRG